MAIFVTLGTKIPFSPQININSIFFWLIMKDDEEPSQRKPLLDPVLAQVNKMLLNLSDCVFFSKQVPTLDGHVPFRSEHPSESQEPQLQPLPSATLVNLKVFPRDQPIPRY